MSGESTWIPLERDEVVGSGQDPANIETDDAWSFGSRTRLFWSGSASATPGVGSLHSSAPNETEPQTFGEHPDRQSHLSWRRSRLRDAESGARRFTSLYQWEGVVEEVNGTGFRARLHALENGRTNKSHVEYAEFDYDDLAYDSDRGLVAPGAVLYWTLGRSRNGYGTWVRTSLLRLRRLPTASARQKREAERLAEELLSELRDEQLQLRAAGPRRGRALGLRPRFWGSHLCSCRWGVVPRGLMSES